MRKVTFLEFNLAPSGHAWLLELQVNNQVVASQLLNQENAPSLAQQREFRNSQPHQSGVVNMFPVLTPVLTEENNLLITAFLKNKY